MKVQSYLAFNGNCQEALNFYGVYFMAYDASPDTPINKGNQIHMSVDSADKAQAEEVFKKLASDGQIHHEFEEREWGYFGRCTDKFGINWMVNYKTE